MALTSKGIWYPDASTPMNLRDILEQLTESVDERLPQVQGGTFTVSGTSVAAGSFVSASTTFPTPFSAVPHCAVSMRGGPGGSNNLTVRLSGSSATGLSVYVFNTGASAATWSNLTVEWIAAQT